MGSDDLFKKRRERRKERKYGFKTPKANSYLIVTEGKCTEPFYFKGLAKLIEKKFVGCLDVISAPVIDIRGEGRATNKLIDTTMEIVSKARIIYQNIWIVFDKDDFDDFNEAIAAGKSKGYKIAWSNQSFEYWLYLHFNYSESALHRKDWCSKLDEIFIKNKLNDSGYQKNYENIYDLVNIHNGVNTAIRNAKRRMENFNPSKINPSEFDPGTTVHILVAELKKYLDE